MRILVLSNIEWDDRNAFGNTVSNLFAGWEDSFFFSLYARSAYPNNNVCDKYFSVSPSSILKNIFQWSRIGKLFNLSSCQHSSSSSEKMMYVYGKKYRWLANIMHCFTDLLYATLIWQNKSYKSAINDFNPDICFLFGKYDVFMYENLKYIRCHTNAKIVLYIVDDVYPTYKVRVKKRFEEMIRMSDLVYGISQPLCNEYSQLFNVPVELLQKGCTITPVTKPQTRSLPYTIVYAGNLYYGRDDVMLFLSRILAEYPKGSFKLDIYTSTIIPEEKSRTIQSIGCVRIHPQKSYNEIMRILSDADIVLHVESNNEAEISRTRLSFSTKIIDYFQSGSAVLTIGPLEATSVRYLQSVEGVLYGNDRESIKSILNDVLSNPDILNESVVKIRNYAMMAHSIDAVQSKLKLELNNLITSR